MRWVEVWSLKRGIIDPPEPVAPEVEAVLHRQDVLDSFGRDPPLSQRQWMEEEGFRYTRRRA